MDVTEKSRKAPREPVQQETDAITNKSSPKIHFFF